jgi:hypothetical protein
MKIMFYAPHSGIKQHSLPESYLARQLGDNSFDISYVTCGRVFSKYCVCMSAVGVSVKSTVIEKNKICDQCCACADILVNNINCTNYSQDEYLVEEDYLNIEKLLDGVNQENFLDFCYDNVFVGKIALYEVLLKYKKMSLIFNEEEWEFYLIYLKNCMLSLLSFIRIYNIDNPDVLILYSPQYAVNGVCAEYMINHDKQVYFTEGSSSNSERYEALRIWDWKIFGLTNPALKYWESKNKNITLESLKRVKGHLEELLVAQSYAVYSSAYTGQFDCRKYFNIPPGKKVILAALSSYDEAYAAWAIDKFPDAKVNSSVYEDQFAWIKRTVEILKDRSDVFLIVRMHPRDFPNKRESVESEQAKVWLKMLEDLPSNMAINVPQDNISIYDLLQGIDLLVTGWSATGVEALAHGIPVVTYDNKMPSYPETIHFTGTSENDYKNNIDKALDYGQNIDYAINAYKWLAFNFSLGVIRTPKFITMTPFDNAFKKTIYRLMNKFFPAATFKYDMRKNEVFSEELSSLVTMIRNGEDSLYSQMENISVANDDVDCFIKNEMFPLLNNNLKSKELNSQEIPDV